MIPVYKMFKTLHLQNSLFGMVLILTGTSVAYATFLYVGFVKSIPKELEEAARIDGCGPYKTFLKIVFPTAQTDYGNGGGAACNVAVERL